MMHNKKHKGALFIALLSMVLLASCGTRELKSETSGDMESTSLTESSSQVTTAEKTKRTTAAVTTVTTKRAKVTDAPIVTTTAEVTTTTTAAPQSGEGLTVSVTPGTSWESGGIMTYQYSAIITNATPQACGWKVSIPVSDGDSVNGWNAGYEILGGTLIITPDSNNPELASGASLEIGFQITASSAPDVNAATIEAG